MMDERGKLIVQKFGCSSLSQQESDDADVDGVFTADPGTLGFSESRA